MTKLCPRGKAAAKRKFKVYPSAYANAYASKICAGKIKDPSGVKRKDFRGPKPVGKAEGGPIQVGMPPRIRRKIAEVNTARKKKSLAKIKRTGVASEKPSQKLPKNFYQKPQNPTETPRLRRPKMGPKPKERQLDPRIQQRKRPKMMGGGMMQMPRAMYGKGGGVCKRGMGRAYGKNS